MAHGAVEKLGQPEVPLRQKKFRHMTIDEKFCQVDERAVIVKKAGNTAETRLQRNRLSYPVETGSIGSRKPEVPVLVQKCDIFYFSHNDSLNGNWSPI